MARRETLLARFTLHSCKGGRTCARASHVDRLRGPADHQTSGPRPDGRGVRGRRVRWPAHPGLAVHAGAAMGCGRRLEPAGQRQARPAEARRRLHRRPVLRRRRVGRDPRRRGRSRSLLDGSGGGCPGRRSRVTRAAVPPAASCSHRFGLPAWGTPLHLVSGHSESDTSAPPPSIRFPDQRRTRVNDLVRTGRLSATRHTLRRRPLTSPLRSSCRPMAPKLRLVPPTADPVDQIGDCLRVHGSAHTVGRR